MDHPPQRSKSVVVSAVVSTTGTLLVPGRSAIHPMCPMYPSSSAARIDREQLILKPPTNLARLLPRLPTPILVFRMGKAGAGSRSRGLERQPRIWVGYQLQPRHRQTDSQESDTRSRSKCPSSVRRCTSTRRRTRCLELEG